jgi:hypothetical protein
MHEKKIRREKRREEARKEEVGTIRRYTKKNITFNI